jgi:signal transduction histidine kinase
LARIRIFEFGALLMNRPWRIWSVFGLSLAVLLAATAWVSWMALRLDHAQAQAQQQAELEEKVRLALWRLDSMLAPLVAQESARPYFVYRPFYPADRAFSRLFNAPQPGEPLVPSPLLTAAPSNVLLHFQFTPGGPITSPQVPTGPERALAEANYVSAQAIQTVAARLRQFEQILSHPAAPELARQAGAVHAPHTTNQAAQGPTFETRQTAAKAQRDDSPAVLRNCDVLLAMCTLPEPDTNPRYVSLPAPIAAQAMAQGPVQSKKGLFQQEDPAQQQLVRNVGELQARAQTLLQALDIGAQNAALNFPPTAKAMVAEGTLKPFWFDGALVLARRVTVQGQPYIQGCWLDWPTLRHWMLEAIKDLLPNAALEPLRDNATDMQARMLAALPIRLVPGAPPGSVRAGLSPVQLVLLVAWGCVLLAAGAVAALLYGAVSLSERRAAFVSAVTHELRTPLTTFKMYSEMLAAGMVTDEAKRNQYLTTLCAEANRLSHLVENVLAYARLERGSARSRIERLSLGDLLVRVKPRLVQRAAQAGVQLVEDADPAVLQTVVEVDVAAVEQILFNLVDNACKYAVPTASEKLIHLEALPERGKFAMLRVRDHGQGISEAAARRLFQPFSKPASEAAGTAPGVGLGLALCRRLSRSMGGDLWLDAQVKPGACFVLSLPVATPA